MSFTYALCFNRDFYNDGSIGISSHQHVRYAIKWLSHAIWNKLKPSQIFKDYKLHSLYWLMQFLQASKICPYKCVNIFQSALKIIWLPLLIERIFMACISNIFFNNYLWHDAKTYSNGYLLSSQNECLNKRIGNRCSSRSKWFQMPFKQRRKNYNKLLHYWHFT